MGISEDDAAGTEVDFVGLVDRPAIERDFLVFKDKHKKLLMVEDEDQHVISGPVMVPDIPIYRNDKENGEYYVVFEAATIAELAHRFFKKGYQGNINLDHEREALVADSVFFESWLVDRQKGKMPLKGFEDLPDGTWFLSAKINNPDAWEKIMAGEVRGFSVEGLFEFKGPVPPGEPSTEEEALQMIADILREEGFEI